MARMTRNMALLDIILIAVLLILLYFFIHRLGYTKTPTTIPSEALKSTTLKAGSSGREIQMPNPPQHLPNVPDDVKKVVAKAQDPVAIESPVVAKKDAVAKDEEVRKEIDARLKKIPDHRKAACLENNHGNLVLATIIIDFFDYQLYDLKVTIGSVLQFSHMDLVKEIIIVDDGSSLDYIIQDSQTFVAGIPKAVLVRNEERKGRLAARLRGVREANGHNLIFLDTSVIVSEGWLEPLLEVLQAKKGIVAQPHFDKINDPVSYEYVPVQEPMVPSMSWSLTVRMGKVKNRDADSVENIKSPMLHGAVFAVTREYFESIGKLDSGIGDSGGEHVELSLRTWFCDGEILTIPCSRVGILNLNDPVKINNYAAVWYITEIWLKTHKDTVRAYFDHDLEKNVDSERKSSMVQRLSTIADMKCPHDMNWFVDNVAKGMFAPSPDAEKFGFLKAKTGSCAWIGPDDRMDLGSCSLSSHKSVHNAAEMSFELMKDGTLKVKGRCIQVMDNAYLRALPCLGKGETKQYWDYHRGQLISRWNKYCFMHVTDPDPKYAEEHRQILMAQDCGMDTTNGRDFSTYEFIKT